MTNPPLIRSATRRDVDAIVSMLVQIHGTHLAWDAARWTTDVPPHVTYGDWIGELVDAGADDGVVLVAEVGGVVGGYVLAEVEPESTRHWSPRAVYLHDLFIAPEHRRSGVAAALVRAVILWGEQHHPGLQLRLMTAAPNEAARAFFAKLGFRACVVEMIRESGDFGVGSGER